MANAHTPSPDQFIVQREPRARGNARHLPEEVRGAVAAQLKRLGAVEEVQEGAPSWIVRVSRAAPDARQAWARLREQLATMLPPLFAEPVLVDGEGEPHLPTGEITVRFDAPRSDAELSAFAGANELRLRSRNPYVAEVAVFVPREPATTYLPELVAHLEGRGGVVQAWANTRSRFRRSTGPEAVPHGR
jgi:hypothetical protein